MSDDTTTIITALGVECYKTEDATTNEELRDFVETLRSKDPEFINRVLDNTHAMSYPEYDKHDAMYDTLQFVAEELERVIDDE